LHKGSKLPKSRQCRSQLDYARDAPGQRRCRSGWGRLLLLAALALVLTPLRAVPAEELVGVYAHGLAAKRGQEGGVDALVGIRTERVDQLPWLLRPAFHFIVAANSSVATDFVAAGVDWPIEFGPDDKFYVRPGFGLAYTTGQANIASPDAPGLSSYERERRLQLSETRIDFGSHVLFEPEIAVGYKITPRLSVEASFIHLSNGQIFHQGKNQGLDDLGLRLARRF
jgi:hypothetical protein